jgi:hypothetical protein
LRVDDDEMRVHDAGEGGEGAVGAAERIEILVGRIHHAEAGELARGRIETGERAVGIAADPDGAVGGLSDAGREGGVVASNGAEVLQSARGMSGVIAEEMAVGVRAEVEHAGARTAEGGGGILLLAGRGVELAAVTGGEVDIEDEQAAVVLAHGGEEGIFAVGPAAGVEADPVDGLDGHAEFADDRRGGDGRGGRRNEK